jgi:hypothetical protein
VKRGAVEGIIDLSFGTDEKHLLLANIIHDEPAKVLVSLLSESNTGNFRRYTIREQAGEKGAKRRRSKAAKEQSSTEE